MRISLQIERIEKTRHQDEEHQFIGLPYVLGTGSTTVAVGYVSRIRPAGFGESQK